MSSLDELLARSRSEGGATERHRFTLAREKALDKIRSHGRLAGSHVVEAIAVGVMANATYIGVELTREDIIVAWEGGRSVGESALTDLFSYAFADQVVRETMHLRQLAVVVLAMLDLPAERIRVESGDGTRAGSHRLDIDAEGGAVLSQPALALNGTVLHVVRERTFLAKLSRYDPSLEEAGDVELACRHTPVPILLNGKAPFGIAPNRSPLIADYDSIVVQTSTFQASLTYENKTSSTLLPVWAGIHLNKKSVEDQLGSGLRVVLLHDGLRRTADMSAVVEDHVWWQALHDLRPHADRLRRARGYADIQMPEPLPPVPAELKPTPEKTAAAVEPAPLPETLRTPGRRPTWTLDQLRSLPNHVPVLWVSRSDATHLGPDAHPLRTPWPLFELTAGQSLTLARELAAKSVTRVASSADLRYLRTVHLAEGDVLAVHAGFDTDEPHERAPIFEVRLHDSNMVPVLNPHGGVPTVVTVAGIAHTVGWTPSNLVNLSLSIRCRPASAASLTAMTIDADQQGNTRFGAPYAERLRALAWRLATHPDLDGSRRSHRQFLASLFELDLELHFVERDGSVVTELSLPSRAGEAAQSLLDFPLADQVDDQDRVCGSLTVRDLAALAGTGKVVRVPAYDMGDKSPLSDLVERIAPGRVLGAGLPQRPLAVLGYRRGSWVRIYDMAHAGEHLAATLTAAPHVGPVPLLADHRVLAPPHGVTPGLTFTVRDNHHLSESARIDAYRRMAAIRSVIYDGGLGRVLRTSLAVALQEPERLVLRALDGREVSVLLPDLALLPRHGAHAVAANIAVVTLDELHAVQAIRRRYKLAPAELVHDDPPEVWRSLSTPEGWLVRTPVHARGVEGWLGLRLPYDATGGVLVETALGRMVVPSPFPCHGVLWSDQPPSDATPLLHASELQLLMLDLLRQLGDLLDRPTSVAVTRAAEAYATLIARHAWRSPLLASETDDEAVAPASDRDPVTPILRAVAARIPTANGDLASDLDDEFRIHGKPHNMDVIGVQQWCRQVLTQGLGAMGDVRIAKLRVPHIITDAGANSPLATVTLFSILDSRRTIAMPDASHPLVKRATEGDTEAREIMAFATLEAFAQVESALQGSGFLRAQRHLIERLMS